MKKENFPLIILALLIILLLTIGVFIVSFLPKKQETATKPPTVTIGGKIINVEVADSPEEREKGLSGRDYLGEGAGMIFVFEEKGYPTFWMKSVKFPLDMVWVNENRIVDITHNAKVEEKSSNLTIYKPKESVNYVLEVKAGFTQENNIKIGDLVELVL
ncbi:MAG: DUF192 domain-containing protein [Candidatus Woykebacteria bacterium]